MSKPKHKQLRRQRLGFLIGAISLLMMPTPSAYASTWNPTYLVNTEAFQVIDEGGGNTAIELRFGDTVDERLFWSRPLDTFVFTDDVWARGTLSGYNLRVSGLTEIHGALTASGAVRFDANLTLNDDADANNAVLTFGSDTTNETLTWANTGDLWEFSDDVEIQGTASGLTLTASNNFTFFSGVASAGTLDHAITAARTWTFPDATTTIVGTDATQTLTNKTLNVNSNTIQAVTGALVFYIDGEFTTGTEQGATLTLPYAFTANDVQLVVKEGGDPRGTAIIVDINEGATTIFSTRPQINVGATTDSNGRVFSDTALAKFSEISVDIDQIGSSKGGTGLTVMLFGTFDL